MKIGKNSIIFFVFLFFWSFFGNSFSSFPSSPSNLRFTRRLTGTENRLTPVDMSLHSPLAKSVSKNDDINLYSIPNLLTIGRTVAIPVFIGCFAKNYYATAFMIYVISSITDFLDGYLARRWNQMSEFGAFLDPVADKLMVGSALILLSHTFPTFDYIIPVVLIFCREIGISALREWMATKNLREVVKVSPLGKWKTAVQMVATSLLLLSCTAKKENLDINLCSVLGIPRSSLYFSGLIALYVSTILAVFSGYEYFSSAWNNFKKAS